MKVSVVIPTYNREQVITKAIDSILNQTWTNVEVIVVDDGSTDNTSHALRRYGNRISYVRIDNSGAAAARNVGVMNSTSDLVAFLDSDDTWHPDKLSRQIECINRTGARLCFCISTDDYGLILDDLQLMDPGLPRHGMKIYNPGDCRMFRYARHPFIQSLLVERDLLIKNGLFDSSLCVAEDTRLIYSLALQHGYSVVNSALVQISRHRECAGLSDSMEGSLALRRYECYARVQAEIWPRVAALDEDAAEAVRSNYLYFLSRLAEIHCAMKTYDEAKRYAKEGLVMQSGWASLCRNIMAIAAPSFLHYYAAGKWQCR